MLNDRDRHRVKGTVQKKRDRKKLSISAKRIGKILLLEIEVCV